MREGWRIASLVEQMEREGVVSPGKREVLIGGVDRGAFDIEAAE